MPEDDFAGLRKLLDDTDAWLDRFAKGPLSPAEQRLADSLRRYVKHCRRDGRKWRSAVAAARAMLKVKAVTNELYLHLLRRPLR